DVYLDAGALRDLAPNDRLGQGILDVLLDRPPQLPRAVRLVVSLLHQRRFGPGVSTSSMPFSVSCLLIRPIINRMISLMWSSDRAWNTMMSSIRFRNSGRNARFISSRTRSFIFS